MESAAFPPRINGLIPNFSIRKLNSSYFLANKAGQWHVLSFQSYDRLKSNRLDLETVEELEKKCLLLSEKNQKGFDLAERMWQRGAKQNDHQIVIVHLTQRCNLTCSYCHSSAIAPSAKNKDITPEIADKVVSFISEIQKPRISVAFQGGEPALNTEEIRYICEGLMKDERNKSKTIEFGITTNGTVHSDELFNLIAEFGIATTISFDGPQDIHDAIRTKYDGTGSFDDALMFRKKLREKASNCSSGAIMVLTRSSVGRTKEIVDQYLDFGQSVIRLKPVTRLGKAKSTWGDNSITFDEYWAAFMDAHKYMIEKYEEKSALVVEHSILTLLRKLFERKNLGDVDSRNPCGIVDGIVSIDIDGKIYACHETKRQKKFLLGNVASGAAKVFESDRAQEIRSLASVGNHNECEACAYHSYCSPCVAHNYQHFRDTKMRPFESWECRKTLAVSDLVLNDFERNSNYYVDTWKAWQLSNRLSDIFSS